ncbi:Ribonuclease P protein component [Buchnera aphidicola (Thelaxes suberi)]|uniref:ribonuclease P protein component n=1 Tax=Buchnera aphidicola TaxID=9 RepID=UPI003463DB53
MNIIFSYPRELRLLTPIQFKKVFKKSYKVTNKELIILGKPNSLLFPRLGISISKKKIKYATIRNKVKRLIKESFRILQHNLMHMDFIVIIKQFSIFLKNNIFFNKINKLWNRYSLINLIHKK